MLYITALASAPAMVSMTPQFFFPTQNGRIDDSQNYPNIRIILRAKYSSTMHWEEELDVL